MALIALLLAILAAAGPTISRRGTTVLTVVVDAGASMSAGQEGQRRYISATADLVRMLRQQVDDDQAVELIAIPPSPGVRGATVDRRTTLGRLTAEVEAIASSALNTAADVRRVISERLADADSRVILVSDQSFETTNARLIQVQPTEALNDLGIEFVAVRRSPGVQAMVRLRKSGTLRRPIILRLSSGGHIVERSIAPANVASDLELFVPLSHSSSLVTAELLETDDDFGANDRFDLIAESDWPVIEPAEAVGDLQRLIDVYTAGRPAGERSIHVRLTSTAARLGTSPGVIISALGLPAVSPTRVMRSVDHPLLAGIDLLPLTLPAADDRRLPPGDWQPILFDHAGPLLAVREITDPLSESIIRQAWCAIDTRAWSQQVEFVLFWAALFDWAGGMKNGGDSSRPDRMMAWPLETLNSQWAPIERARGGERAVFWPGVYQRQGDSRRRAFVAGPLQVDQSVTTGGDVASKISALTDEGRRKMSLSPYVLLLALSCLGAAGLLWRRRGEHRALKGVTV